VLAALLFAGLNIGGLSMQQIGIPPELIKIIIASFIIFVASGYAIRLVIEKFAVEKESKKAKGAGQ
jgi:simple sugar transport system permease protein